MAAMRNGSYGSFGNNVPVTRRVSVHGVERQIAGKDVVDGLKPLPHPLVVTTSRRLH